MWIVIASRTARLPVSHAFSVACGKRLSHGSIMCIISGLCEGGLTVLCIHIEILTLL